MKVRFNYKNPSMKTALQNKMSALRFKDEQGTDYPDWEEINLGKICKIVTGKLDVNAMVDGGQYRFYTCAREHFWIDKFAFDTEALLISGNGANVGYIHYYSGKFNAYQRTYVLDRFEENIFYIKYFLEQHLRKRINHEKKEGNTPYIVLNTLAGMSLTIPHKNEQQKIAAFLSSVDTKIEQLNKKKSLLEQYKKGMMQKLFSQEIRFKDEQGREYPDWEEKKVCEVFKITRGNVLAVNKLTPGLENDHNYPVFSSQTKNNGLMGYYTDYLYESAITWTTDGANAGEVKYRDGKFYCTNVCGVLLSEAGFANQCISEMLNKVTRKYVSYVGNPKLMNKVMAAIKIRFPSLIEQQKIASFLSAIDKKIELVTEQIRQAQTFKKGLLQQMFV